MPHSTVYHRDLVEHFRSFTDGQRERLSSLYSFGPRASSLARGWCEEPDRVRNVVESRLAGDLDATSLMTELVFQHDLQLDIGWSTQAARTKLAELGVLSPRGRSGGAASVPGAVAAVLSPLLDGTRTTLLTLLGAQDDDYVARVARCHGFVEGSSVDRILDVAGFLSEPEGFNELVASLEDPEILGAALSVLESGGVCFWQEVFGHDLHTNPDFGDNVVAFMRSDDRENERALADGLMDLGFLFRVEDDVGGPPLAVVPEELWFHIWSIGRTWLLDWTAAGIEVLQENGTRRANQPRSNGWLQPALKWLSCEAARGALKVDGTDWSSSTLRMLEDAGGDEIDWRATLELGRELSALQVGSKGGVSEVGAFQRVIDLPSGVFNRQILMDWVTGYIGADADANAGKALGLDEEWAALARELTASRAEFVPQIMRVAGVEPRVTGAGVLRNAEDSTQEQLILETSLLNGLLWAAKLVWLDVLSLLDSDIWYPVGHLVELLQVSCSLGIFGQLLHVLEQPDFGIYLPVQRSSLLNDPFHTPEFERWVDDLLECLLVPLGVAAIDPEQRLVWLDPSQLRVETPPGLTDDERQMLVREIFADPELPFRVPAQYTGALRPVNAGGGNEFVDLDQPLDVVKRWLGDRPVHKFDGRRIYAAAVRP